MNWKKFLLVVLIVPLIALCFGLSKMALTAVIRPLIVTPEAVSKAKNDQIEKIAKHIADNLNTSVTANTIAQDGPARAESNGKNVIFIHYITLKPGVSQADISQWQQLSESEILPGVCGLNKGNPAFIEGLSYTFSYRTRDERPLMNVYVDWGKCKRMGYVK